MALRTPWPHCRRSRSGWLVQGCRSNPAFGEVVGDWDRAHYLRWIRRLDDDMLTTLLRLGGLLLLWDIWMLLPEWLLLVCERNGVLLIRFLGVLRNHDDAGGRWLRSDNWEVGFDFCQNLARLDLCLLLMRLWCGFHLGCRNRDDQMRLRWLFGSNWSSRGSRSACKIVD